MARSAQKATAGSKKKADGRKSDGKKKSEGKAGGGGLAALVGLAAFAAVTVNGLRSRTRPGGRAQPGGSHRRLERIDVGGEPSNPPPDFLRRIDGWQRAHAWSAFPVGVIRKFADDRAGYLAALVAYFGFFSLFPLMLALTSILGFVLDGNPDLQEKISDSAFEQIPIIGSQISTDVGSLTGSTIAIVVGVAGALWAGLRVVDAAQNALNEVWDVDMTGRPNIVERRLRGLGVLLLIGLALLASLVASGLAGLLPDLPGGGRFAIYAITLLLNVGIFLMAFQVLSQVDHAWGDLLPGAVVAAVGWTALQTFGTSYVARTLSNAQSTYGDFASVIALLSFFFVVSQIVIVGAEVNVVRARRLWPRSLVPVPGELTDADRRAYLAYMAAGVRVKGTDLRVEFPESAAPARQD